MNHNCVYNVVSVMDMFCIVLYMVLILVHIYAVINVICIDSHITHSMYLPYVFNKIHILYSEAIIVVLQLVCVFYCYNPTLAMVRSDLFCFSAARW